MAIVGHTVQTSSGQPLTIYGETANINYFLSGNLDPDTVGGAMDKVVSAPAGSRRRYPGAPAISYSGSTREIVVDPSRRSGNALPGKTFILKEFGNQAGNEQRQFTFRGRMIDLHGFLSASSGRPFYLYGPSGARYTIADSTIPTGP